MIRGSEMTITNASKAQSQRPTRRSKSRRAGAIGLVAGLIAALGSVQAAPTRTAMPMIAMAQATASQAVDPAKQSPAAVSISSIDFKRGDGGSGKLIMRFSGDGAAPDLRTQGSSVVVNVGNASLPASLQRPLNVTDFATPVQRIDAKQSGSGTQLVLSTNGSFESLAYQTGRDYIVEIVPRAASDKRAVGAATGAATAAAGQQSTSVTASRAYGGRPVTFNFQDVPVRTVLQLIAEESNLNIVASDTVQGNVTLRLINVPWDQALDIVLQAKSLDKRRSGNVVWVAPQAEIAKFEQDKEDARIAIENRAETVTEYIPINYGNAEDIAKLLTDESKNSSGAGGGGGANAGSRGFLSPRGSISFDRRTNTMLVIDIPQKVAEIKRLVLLLDKPVDQVVIEARIVIANENFARELGAKFGISGNKNNAYFSGNLEANSANRNSEVNTNIANQTAQNTYNSALAAWLAGGSNGPQPIPPVLRGSTITSGLNINLPTSFTNAGSLALSVLNAGYLLEVELSALQTEGRGEVISNPRVVTSNQKEAVIRQGQEVGYVTLTGGGTTGAALPSVQFKDVLLELKVTPTITNDGRVFLAMNVKKDEIQGFINTSIGDVPQIAKREVNTAVLIEDGQTVVIGGVYEFKSTQDVQKVPFLGDIPFLGNLFKKKGRSKEKAELLIFVTPKVLRVAQRN
jgi:type IV pilus assembly protein PilQ